VYLPSDADLAPTGTDTDPRSLSRGLLPYCAPAGASVCSGLGAGVAAGAAAGVSATGLSGVAAGGSAIALTAAMRFGAARFFLIALSALARPRVAFFTGGDLPRRVVVLRRAGAVLRFVVDTRLPAFLVLVVFAFDFRAVLAMMSPSWRDDSLFCRVPPVSQMHFTVLPVRFTIFLNGDGDERNFWGGPSRGRQVGARVLAGGCAVRRGAKVASDAGASLPEGKVMFFLVISAA
jgi:hypothetical protein